MLLALPSCKKKSEPDMASKDNLFSDQVINVPEGIDGIYSMTATNDKIYIIGQKSIEVKNSSTTGGEASDQPAAGGGGVIERAVLNMAVTGIVETVVSAADESAADDTADTIDAGEEEPVADVPADAADEPEPVDDPAEATEVMYYQQFILFALDYEGNKLSEAVIYDSQKEDSENSSKWPENMFIDNSGRICIMQRSYSWDPETGDGSEGYVIERYDEDFKLVSTTDLSSLKDNYEGDENNNYFYVNSYTEDSEGNGYTSVNNNIMVTDSSGKYLYTVKLEGEASSGNSGTNINGVICGKDGTVYVQLYKWSNVDDNYTSSYSAKVLDAATGKLSDTEYEMTVGYYGGRGNGTSSDYDFISSDNTSLFGYNVVSGEKTPIIDWVKSGIDTTAQESVIVTPDGRVVYSAHDYKVSEGGGYSYSSNDLILHILTKIDPSTVPDKQLISVYCMWLNYDLKRAITSFNKESDKYQIEVTSYEDQNSNVSYDEMIKRLNNDLVAGKIPDILLVDSNIPFESYVSKGLIADLNGFFEKDETIKREDYLENVLEAFSMDGKLYRIAPSFNIQTLAAKKSIVGDKTSWTVDEFLEVAKNNPDAKMFGDEMTNSNFLNQMIMMNIGSYINYETGECHFDSDSFKKLLEYAKDNFPTEINYDELYSDDNYWQEREMAYREGKAILRSEYIYNLRTLKYDEVGYMGEETTFIGVPSDNGCGSTIYPNTTLAVMAKAKNPDGAWEFIKTLLSDEAQSSNMNSGLPLKLSAYDKLKEKAKEKPYWENEKGEKEYYDDNVWVGEQQFVCEPNTDEDNERMMDFIKSVTNVASYDSDLFKIIEEETQAYFSGQKSAGEVTELIQNRVSTYVNENM